MDAWGIPGYVWLLGASLVTFLLAAKTHGRQIRLERELQGFHDVDFRKENPPFVETLWRRDRIRYWVRVGLLSPFFVFGFSIWAAAGLRLPGFEGAPGLGQLLAVTGLGVVLWSTTLAFLVNALGSLQRLRTELEKTDATGAPRHVNEERERPAWLRSARRGTVGWFAASLAGILAIVGMVGAGL